MSELLFNELPRPTFRWLRVNHTPASLWGESETTTAVLVKGNDAIISPLPSGTALMNTNYKGANGEAVAKLVSEAEGYRIHVPAKAKEERTYCQSFPIYRRRRCASRSTILLRWWYKRGD